MRKEFIIEAKTGQRIDILKGQTISIIDLEGGQVADFFAIINDKEFLSTGVTIDCNESLKLKAGDIIYTNHYNKMFEVIYDDVGEHDLLHPCCREEMYDFFYKNGVGHPNCLNNINNALDIKMPIITPVNIFMNTKMNVDGSISVEKPISKAGDKIILKALIDSTIGIAACSVSESKCNSGKCTAIKVIIE